MLTPRLAAGLREPERLTIDTPRRRSLSDQSLRTNPPTTVFGAINPSAAICNHLALWQSVQSHSPATHR